MNKFKILLSLSNQMQEPVYMLSDAEDNAQFNSMIVNQFMSAKHTNQPITLDDVETNERLTLFADDIVSYRVKLVAKAEMKDVE
ncbi:hypothetical protein CON15_04995 [Bacillus cereus]|uniref:Uncharacterized protein n=2 Tax=root TaxID=1 RepID=A0A1Z1LZL6_9CAUD|nr:hypothetical protein [Streptococcus pneumoniae]YP_009833653.1 hypothetical protein HWB22_gp13 [Bacillus phage Deep-Purple]PDZ59384.1 hypothetical protein CON15_04995 [Bacillus cereus]ARW58263.1 hypothetical protein DeepPurple_gp012 [Bacillus phage Deep-Purple]PEE91361.1 hypothetical protein COM92_28925 [Bacillus cereus]PGN76112.1 hypothetical protein CN967_18585 [Bacillus cereus]PGO75728.1 hypothetical protein CN985_04795 [Bacillus cereus]